LPSFFCAISARLVSLFFFSLSRFVFLAHSCIKLFHWLARREVGRTEQESATAEKRERFELGTRKFICSVSFKFRLTNEVQRFVVARVAFFFFCECG
jgi:hypothetical protein